MQYIDIEVFDFEGDNIVMKTLNFLSLSLILVLTACGDTPRRSVEPQEARYNLMQDDGNGVIFTSYETLSGSPAQIKVFDSGNCLRHAIKGTNCQNAPSYSLKHAPIKVAIFDFDYNGRKINELICDSSLNNNNTNLSSHFYFVYDDQTGLTWTQVSSINSAPIHYDTELSCIGDGEGFSIYFYRNFYIKDLEYTLYFDFVSLGFMGKVSIVKSNRPLSEAVHLYFD